MLLSHAAHSDQADPLDSAFGIENDAQRLERAMGNAHSETLKRQKMEQEQAEREKQKQAQEQARLQGEELRRQAQMEQERQTRKQNDTDWFGLAVGIGAAAVMENKMEKAGISTNNHQNTTNAISNALQNSGNGAAAGMLPYLHGGGSGLAPTPNYNGSSSVAPAKTTELGDIDPSSLSPACQTDLKTWAYDYANAGAIQEGNCYKAKRYEDLLVRYYNLGTRCNFPPTELTNAKNSIREMQQNQRDVCESE